MLKMAERDSFEDWTIVAKLKGGELLRMTYLMYLEVRNTLEEINLR